MNKKFINNFLDFEKNSNIINIPYSKVDIWPLVRNSVFHEILKEKKLLQTPSNLKPKKKLYTFSILKLFKNIYSILKNFYRKKDIILLNYDRKINIDGTKQNLLVWSINKSLKNYRILVLDTCGIDLNSSYVADVSYIMKSVRNISRFIKNKKWENYSKKINALIKKEYDVDIELKDVYVNSYIHQLWIKNLLKIFLFFNKPKLVIFSQEGSYPFLINELNKRNIPTIDFQHGMQSGSIPIFKHNINLSNDYINFLPNYVFTYGNYWNKYYSDYSNPISVGNPYYDYMVHNSKDIEKEKNSILIVSDGLLERKKLISLSKKISENIKDVKIYYKLRAEEYADAHKYYNELYKYDNIVVISNEDNSIYSFIKKSNYVIGINSTVLIEASKFCTVIVYKTGWYYEMLDLIQSGYFLLGESENDVINMINSKKKAKSLINIDEIYQPDPEKKIRSNIDLIIG